MLRKLGIAAAIAVASRERAIGETVSRQRSRRGQHQQQPAAGHVRPSLRGTVAPPGVGQGATSSYEVVTRSRMSGNTSVFSAITAHS